MRTIIGLVGDIGGTNCRLALVENAVGHTKILARTALSCSDHPDPESAITAFLATHKTLPHPQHAVLAVAGPVHAGSARLTNLGWHLGESTLAKTLDFTRVKLINDFAALAFAAPLLQSQDCTTIGTTTSGEAGATIAVMGPGTGFGASALAGGTHHGLLVTEAGHIGFAPTDEIEREILRILAVRHGRVSIERILAGRGLANLHAALEQIAGTPPSGLDAAGITAKAAEGDSPSLATIERFCAILGSVTGDLALAYGAQGGVFIAGGIAPRMLTALSQGSFRTRFEQKGRFTAYMQAIPTKIITTQDAALRGAADALWRLAYRQEMQLT